MARARHRGQVPSLPRRERERETKRGGERQKQEQRGVGEGGNWGWEEGFHFIGFQNYRIHKALKLREGRLFPKAKE